MNLYVRFLLMLACLWLLPELQLHSQTVVPSRLPYSAGLHTNSFTFDIANKPALKAKYPKDPNRQPFYRYFWEFGDGNFSREANPLHTYKDVSVDYEPSVRLLRVYDDDDDAPDHIKLPPTGSPISFSNKTSQRNNRTPRMFGTAIALQTDFDPRPGDSLICVITYSNECITPQSGGRITLTYDDDFYGTPKLQAFHGETINASTMDGNLVINWSYPTGVVEQRNIFVRFNTTSGPGFVGKDFPLSASITEDSNTCTGGSPTSTGLSRTVVNSHDPNFKYMEDAAGTEELCYDGIYTLECRVDFQNIGAGPANRVIVQDFIDEDLEPGTINLQSSKFQVQSIDFDPNTRLQTWEFNSLNLRGLAEPQAGIDFPIEDTEGYLVYTVETMPLTHQCQKLLNQAIITFDCNEAIATNLATVSVCGDDIGCTECGTLPTDTIEHDLIVGSTNATGLTLLNPVNNNPVNLNPGPIGGGLQFGRWYPLAGLSSSTVGDPQISGVWNPYNALSNQRLHVPGYYFSYSQDCESGLTYNLPLIACGQKTINTQVSYDCSGTDKTATIKAWLTNAAGQIDPSAVWFNCADIGGDTLILEDIRAGSYQISAVDNQGCAYSKLLNLDIPIPLWVDQEATNNGGTCTLQALPSGGKPNYQYLWSDNSTNSTLTVNLPFSSSVSVTVTDQDGCSSIVHFDACPQSTSNGPVGLGTALLFPNPAMNLVVFQFSEPADKGEIMLYDVYGRLVSTQELKMQETKVAMQLEGLAAGVYTYVIQQEGGMQSGKLLKL